jgi:hypothetical protein
MFGVAGSTLHPDDRKPFGRPVILKTVIQARRTGGAARNLGFRQGVLDSPLG